ncbi:TPA: O-antigen ligase family protein, partial [Streptococcus suis]
MSLTLIILFIFTNLIRNATDLDSAFWALAWSGICTVIYYGLLYGFRTMILLRSEVSTVPFLNANIYGLCTFFSAVGFLYLYMTREKKIVNLLLMLLMLGLSVLTGSRKVLMLCLIIVLGTYVFSNLKSSIYRVIILLSILCGFYILVMHNNFLYTIIGVRIEETLNFFTDQGVASNTSTGIRNSMIKLGYQLFRLKPLIGYGVMGTYTYNNGTYLHNNYFELLVNTGLIGTIIY